MGGSTLGEAESMKGKHVLGYSWKIHFQKHLIILYFERNKVSGGEAKEERESQAGYVFSTGPNAGLSSTTMRSWPERKSRVGHFNDWAT